MIKYIIYIFVLLSCTLLAQTEIPAGVINSDVSWDSTNAPYYINGDVTIEKLIINPGVSVLFRGSYKLTIDGQLSVNGVYSDSVFFKTAEENKTGWQGIEVNPGSNVTLQYCRIEDAMNEALLVDNAETKLENCAITQNSGNGMQIENCKVEIHNCRIRENGKNGIVLENGKALLYNSIIDNNSDRGISSYNDSDSMALMNSIVIQNGKDGLLSLSGFVMVTNSIIYDNAQKEINAGDTEKIFVSYSAVQGDELYAGEGNINQAPEFASELHYTLAEHSPCIDAGSDSVVYNDRFFPPSLGEIRNDMGAYGGPGAGQWYPPLLIQPEVLDFGEVSVLQRRTLNFSITNYREVPIVVSGVFFDGADSQVYSSDMENFVADTSTTTQLAINFRPEQQENYPAALSLKTESMGSFSGGLSGTGIMAIIEPREEQLSFNSVSLGDSLLLHLPILNTGSDTLKISKFFTHGIEFYTSESSLTINPHLAVDTISVIFKPDSAKNYTDSLVILCNDPFNHRLVIPLTGDGEGPVIDSQPENYDFGTITVDDDSLMTITVSNLGNEPLQVSSASITGEDSGVEFFSLNSSMLPRQLAPDSTMELYLTYRPLYFGDHQALIEIVSSDALRDRKMVQVSGFAEAALLRASTLQLNFDSLQILTDSSLTVTFFNDGNNTLNIPLDSMDISGIHAAEFGIRKPEEAFELIPGDSARLDIKFNPVTEGVKEARLTIVSNSMDTSHCSISLNGKGVDNRVAIINPDEENSSDEFIAGSSGALGFTVSSSAAVDSVVLYIRLSGEQNYTTMVMSQQGSSDLWVVDINDWWITERGFEYYVSVSLDQASTLWPLKGAQNPVRVRVTVSALSYPFSTKQNKYQKISLPLESSLQMLDDLFSDDLGEYNDKKYRVFDCLNGKDYTEIVEMDIPLPAGKSLWLITKNPVNLDMENGRSTSADEAYIISLRKGWNMIANPFAFPVSWSTVEMDSLLHLQYYDGVDWQEVNEMEPYKGYAVYSNSVMDLLVPAIESDQRVSASKPGFAENEEEWQIQLSAYSGGQRDVNNFAGIRSSAKRGHDGYDVYEPSTPGNALSLYMVADSSERKLSADYRSPDQRNYEFSFKLAAANRDIKTIKVDKSSLPQGTKAFLFCEETDVLHKTDNITTRTDNSLFKLFVGSEDYLNKLSENFKGIPEKFHLTQNFPNPFNPLTTVRYQIPHAGPVSAEIYNVLGQKISVLQNNVFHDAGYYSLTWNGRNQSGIQMSSGIYFFLIRYNQNFKAIKMLLKR